MNAQQNSDPLGSHPPGSHPLGSHPLGSHRVPSLGASHESGPAAPSDASDAGTAAAPVTASGLSGSSAWATSSASSTSSAASAPAASAATPSSSAFGPSDSLQLWGGIECTINRVGDAYYDQSRINGVDARDDDIARIASLGLRAVRYPILWEKVAPDGPDTADWTLSDARLPALRQRGIAVIAGLVHHGSGPPSTSLLDPQFGDKLARYAGAVAQRYPWIEAWTPVNEPLTTARFSALYGAWYPHARDEHSFVRAVFHQCRATVLAMRAIRLVNPAARLVQTDDLGKTYSTDALAGVAGFYNERRWLAWDLLCGKVDQQHQMWPYLREADLGADEILWFRDNPCPPDIIGVNYYVTSERWLDDQVQRFPSVRADTVFGLPCIDVEAARAIDTPTEGIGPLLDEVWQRYRLPLAITEAHLDAGREDQLRWMDEIWQAAGASRARGIDLRAVTAWSLLGAHDWNSLVTRLDGYYEPGAFDTRFAPPRATAVAHLLRKLAAGDGSRHPTASGRGWWRRTGRLALHGDRLLPGYPADPLETVDDAAPILISGAGGTLGRAFARICQQRNLAHRLLGREAMDIADPSSVERALDLHRPWAVINASGYVRVDEAERDVERCFRENAIGPAILAAACARHNIHLTTFSSDLVFDGSKHHPYVETDAVAPLNVYGRSKAEGEQLVFDSLPAALVVRTSCLFGPWDEHNFLVKALGALRAGSRFSAPHDLVVSPTYVPDLVDVCLDLIIDDAAGIWHLTNGPALCWMEFAHRAALAARIDPSRLSACGARDCNFLAPRPAYSALRSARAALLPALDDALDRFLRHHAAGNAGRSPHPAHQL